MKTQSENRLLIPRKRALLKFGETINLIINLKENDANLSS